MNRLRTNLALLAVGLFIWEAIRGATQLQWLFTGTVIATLAVVVLLSFVVE